MNVRVGENNKSWFRCDRIMHVNDKWFFVTREFSEEGPFISRHEAELVLMLYIRHVNNGLDSKGSVLL